MDFSNRLQITDYQLAYHWRITRFRPKTKKQINSNFIGDCLSVCYANYVKKLYDYVVDLDIIQHCHLSPNY